MNRFIKNLKLDDRQVGPKSITQGLEIVEHDATGEEQESFG